MKKVQLTLRKSFKQTIRINPDSELLYLFLAGAYGKLGMHKEAHKNLGYAYRESGKYEEAIEPAKKGSQ